jgi:hypothetical protein
MKRLAAALPVITGTSLSGAAAAAARPDSPAAVVFLCHHFGDARYPPTNIRPEQFDAHLVP